ATRASRRPSRPPLRRNLRRRRQKQRTSRSSTQLCNPSRATCRLRQYTGCVAKQMMVFPFTVPLDGSGRMLDQAQGVYARSLARTLAERLTAPPRLAANLATLTADGPLDGENGEEGHGWIVASQPWTLEEACH